MGMQDFFTNLPSEISINILSRLPIRSISISKCVCKAWLDLIESDYFDFAKSKIKTPFTIVRTEKKMNFTRCTIWEFEDEDEADALHFHPLTDIQIPYNVWHWWPSWVHQTNGLLLLYTEMDRHNYICNPLTREYIDLGRPDVSPMGDGLYFGFGVSKIGQYKVVCVNSGAEYHHVYALGTGTWRCIEAGVTSGCRFDDIDRDRYTVCHGNPHWAVYNIDEDDKTLRICAFDVETESFSIFSAPDAHGHAGHEGAIHMKLNIFGGCLCLSYALGTSEYFVTWLMKEYQVEESWTKHQIRIDCDYEFVFTYMTVAPIKVYKNGDVLMFLDDVCLVYYSNKTRTTQRVGMFDNSDATFFTPSLFSLKNFGGENVISFQMSMHATMSTS